MIYTAICVPNQLSHNGTSLRQVQGYAIILFFVCVEDGTCIRNKHIFLSSNDTKDSLTLFLVQQLINQSNSENLVTVSHINVIANLGGKSCSRAHGVSTQEDVDMIVILHAV